jgi:iron complex outermembrane receptor protein
MKVTSALAVLASAFLLAAVPALASETHELTGTVVSAGGDPAADAVVNLPELRRQTTTDQEGRFTFSNLPDDEILVSVNSTRFGGAVQRVRPAEWADGGLTITLDQRIHAAGITVTATGVARSLDEVINPVSVLSGEDLVLRQQSTLGETLGQQPGVASTTYGQGSSRPVIRGLGEDRIRILENGLDTGDVSSIGPDHAVSTDALAAEQVEVVRGPAALLWGANAIGGVVNVLDGRVPDRPAKKPVTGAIQLEYGSNADKVAGAAKLDGGTGKFAWHADLYARDQGDYTSPARRPVEDEHDDHGDDDGDGDGDDHDHEEEYETGTVENSFTEAQGATLGGSYVTDRGFIGVAVGGYDTTYGIPGHHHHEEHEEPLKLLDDDDDDHHEEEEAGVRSELEQRRVDVHGQLDNPFGGFSALRLSAGWRDYEHNEIEGDELGTRFENQWTEARIDALNKPWGSFSGTMGLHWSNRDFSAFGEEAYVQPTDTTRWGVYIFEQSTPDPVAFQFGLRYDRQDSSTVDPDLPDRTFDMFSASVGLVAEFSDFWGFSVSLNRPERAPTPEELYSNGPHAATRAYEIGDPYLETEVGNGVEATIRADYDRVELTLSGFATKYNDFIYLQETGEEIDELEVLQFAQDDTEFYGFELHGDFELLHRGDSHLHLGFAYDQVRAAFRSSGDPVPRIPPRRAKLALVYITQRWDARLEGWWVDDQNRVAEHEEPTPGYEMLNASVGYKFFAGQMMHELLLRGRNLTDEPAYNHVSFIKFEAPLPGRDISLIYRFLF